MSNKVGYSDNIDFLKDVFELNEVIIPNLIKKTLFLHALTFPEMNKSFSNEELIKIKNELKTFLSQSQSYLDIRQDSCQ